MQTQYVSARQEEEKDDEKKRYWLI